MTLNGLHLYVAGVLAMWVWLAARGGRPTTYLLAMAWPVTLLLLVVLLILDAVTPESDCPTCGTPPGRPCVYVPGDGSTSSMWWRPRIGAPPHRERGSEDE